MLEARAKWVSGLQFIGFDTQDHSVAMDASTDSGGEGAGFRPPILVLIGLAGCTGMDIVNILQKGRHDVVGLEVKATGENAMDPPWPIEAIHVEYIVRGRGISEDAVRRAIELSEKKYCSVWATLAGRATITSSYRIEAAL